MIVGTAVPTMIVLTAYYWKSRLLSGEMAIFTILCPWDKMRNGPYLGSGAKNDKNKTTFYSQTLKVGENKVPLF